jgi:hypothetical protein
MASAPYQREMISDIAREKGRLTALKNKVKKPHLETSRRLWFCPIVPDSLARKGHIYGTLISNANKDSRRPKRDFIVIQ